MQGNEENWRGYLFVGTQENKVRLRAMKKTGTVAWLPLCWHTRKQGQISGFWKAGINLPGLLKIWIDIKVKGVGHEQS